MKYTIEYVKKPIAKDYIGMNFYAAKELHIPFNHKHPAHTIVIDKAQSKPERTSTIHHEESEAWYMKNKHFHYKHAHRLALAFERMHKPFTPKLIK